MITVYYYNNVVERHYCDNVMNYTVYINNNNNHNVISNTKISLLM